ncbi:MAG: response regulator [Bacteroidota bacterium]
MNSKPNLLIVEDDDLLLKVYRSVFAKDFNLTMCQNDIEFDAAIEKDKYQIFLIDISLVGTKDGIQLIKELRQIDDYKTIPIMVVTANAFKRDEEITMAAGATKYYRKPIDYKILLTDFKKYCN